MQRLVGVSPRRGILVDWLVVKLVWLNMKVVIWLRKVPWLVMSFETTMVAEAVVPRLVMVAVLKQQ